MGMRERRQALHDKKDARKERDKNPEQRWEYKARNMSRVAGMSIETDFNGLGQQGWEFVAMASGGTEGYAIFKRRIPSGSDSGATENVGLEPES